MKLAIGSPGGEEHMIGEEEHLTNGFFLLILERGTN